MVVAYLRKITERLLPLSSEPYRQYQAFVTISITNIVVCQITRDITST